MAVIKESLRHSHQAGKTAQTVSAVTQPLQTHTRHGARSRHRHGGVASTSVHRTWAPRRACPSPSGGGRPVPGRPAGRFAAGAPTRFRRGGPSRSFGHLWANRPRIPAALPGDAPLSPFTGRSGVNPGSEREYERTRSQHGREEPRSCVGPRHRMTRGAIALE